MGEEFPLAQNYSSLNKTKRLLITPDKLKGHFEKHFSPRNLQIQPEIENPDLFPHILPPENAIINEDVPTEDELRQVIKKQKDSKCQGTDKIYAEHIKYAKSDKLIGAVLLLFIMIWTKEKGCKKLPFHIYHEYDI